MRTRIALLWISYALCAGQTVSAQSSDLIGDWDIVSTGFAFVGNSTSTVQLSIEEADGEWRAFAFNGPIALRVDGDTFEFDMDWASGFDEEYLSTFSGRITADGELEGTTKHNGARNFLGRAWKDGSFTGTRAAVPPQLDGLDPEPVDMSGVYNRAANQWPVRKVHYAMTDRGQGIIDNYKEMDNANSRCASPGLILATGLPYPMEILHAENSIVIVYGADYARRVYLDDREFPETGSSSSLGFSTGVWKGETLVVTTTRLNPAFISTRGQPVSAEAYTTEHFFFDDRGYLHADLWLHDPINYTRPPYIKRVYDQNFNPLVITKVDCDPYSFFRALALEDELEEFWRRSEYRR